MSTTEGQTGASASAGSIVPAASGVLDKLRRRLGGAQVPPAPPPPPGSDGDEEEDGMLRMSFMEHLEELRSRLLKMIFGVIVAAVVSLSFSQPLWTVVCQPAVQALKALGYEQTLVQISPMDAFNIIWFKLPILCAIFLASPWVLYQVWAFISPGLYRREKRWASPFILCSAGLFIIGGLFAYFVIFRYGLTFLLGIGQGNYVKPMISMDYYFDLFVNVMLGVGLVFEMPVLMFFLTLLRIVSPTFMLRHSRYAILAIFIIAAIVTPDAGRLQPDAVRYPDVPAVLCGYFRGVSISTAPGRQAIPMEDYYAHNSGRTNPGNHRFVLCYYQVRLSLGTEVALFNSLSYAFRCTIG